MSTADPTVPLVVDEHVAARALAVSLGWLRADRRAAKIIPVCRIGRNVRYDLQRCREALLTLEHGGPLSRGQS